MRGRKGKRWWSALTSVGVVVLLTKGLAVRHVLWEGDAPISFGTMARVNQHLQGRPVWLCTERQIHRWLANEMVEEVRVRWRLPHTVVITATAPTLVAMLPNGSWGILADDKGRLWRKVPLYATRLPFLLLTPSLAPDRVLPIVKRTLQVCAQEQVTVRAVWVTPYGEVAVYLPQSGWWQLGNSVALPLKVRLGKALQQHRLSPPDSVIDLSLMRVIALRSQEEQGERRR